MTPAQAQPYDTPDPLVEPASQGLTRAGTRRVDGIDMLRGLMIALMVLDHVRDFFGTAALADPTNADTSWPLLFATRWVTHLCAPTFVLLSGVSIFLQSREKARGALSLFLLKRGVWLVILELTIVGLGFNFGEPFIFLQVIWAIGFGMICMAALARLPSGAVLAIGVALIAAGPWLVNATDGAEGGGAVLRALLIAPNVFPSVPALAMYPALPWLGIMCLGFGLGPVFRWETARRARAVLILAAAFLATFVLLRMLNGYGDPSPWAARDEGVRTAMSFLDISKYPPSPDYVLATLGVSFLLFLALGWLRGPLARVLLDFGRTPLFTYLLHIYIAHGAMWALAAMQGEGHAALFMISGQIDGSAQPSEWGYGLGGVTIAWAAVLLVLAPLSHWFAGVKRRRRDWWLGYI